MRTNQTSRLLGQLRTIVGNRYVLTRDFTKRRYLMGFRVGGGDALAVVRPASLLEQWKVFVACIEADHIVILQAANTGLTGGSTPQGRYDRAVVVINTTRIRGIRLIKDGRQAVCLSGARLYELERQLRPLGREPHSVIGSSCLGASVVGGVCNNSGGALVRRGPAYTEYAVYAGVDSCGRPYLENRLGIRLGQQPEQILTTLERGEYAEADIVDDGRVASCLDYPDKVRKVDESTPARFNADPAGLFEASGCAGKLMVLAVRVNTFPAEKHSTTFYIGTNDTAKLTTLRRRILTEFSCLPIAGEYIHRDAYVLAERYGKDLFLAIRLLGTHNLPRLFAAKGWLDGIAARFGWIPRHPADRLLQAAGRLFPPHLPSRMTEFRDLFAHHLILKMPNDGNEPLRKLLQEIFPGTTGSAFECTEREERDAFQHRFAVAGAAIRYRAVHPGDVEDIISLDVALRRNDRVWFEQLPEDIGEKIHSAIYYGHFFCHVFHHDYIVAKDPDTSALELRMLELLDRRGARYPAEHNVGHRYEAESGLAAHYRTLDPENCLNPGLGGTSRNKGWH